jgi:hypothetical protein
VGEAGTSASSLPLSSSCTKSTRWSSSRCSSGGLIKVPRCCAWLSNSSHRCPRDLNVLVASISAPPEPFVPEQHRLKPGYALMVVGFGPPEQHGALTERIRTTLPPLFEFITPMPYLGLQQMQDEANAWGLCYEKGTRIPALTDETSPVIAEHAPRRNSPLSGWRRSRPYTTRTTSSTATRTSSLPSRGRSLRRGGAMAPPLAAEAVAASEWRPPQRCCVVWGAGAAPASHDHRRSHT